MLLEYEHVDELYIDACKFMLKQHIQEKDLCILLGYVSRLTDLSGNLCFNPEVADFHEFAVSAMQLLKQEPFVNLVDNLIGRVNCVFDFMVGRYIFVIREGKLYLIIFERFIECRLLPIWLYAFTTIQKAVADELDLGYGWCQIQVSELHQKDLSVSEKAIEADFSTGFVETEPSNKMSWQGTYKERCNKLEYYSTHNEKHHTVSFEGRNFFGKNSLFDVLLCMAAIEWNPFIAAKMLRSKQKFLAERIDDGSNG